MLGLCAGPPAQSSDAGSLEASPESVLIVVSVLMATSPAPPCRRRCSASFMASPSPGPHPLPGDGREHHIGSWGAPFQEEASWEPRDAMQRMLSSETSRACDLEPTLTQEKESTLEILSPCWVSFPAYGWRQTSPPAQGTILGETYRLLLILVNLVPMSS